jgi:hypothetical protein
MFMAEKGRRPKRGRESRARETPGRTVPVSIRLTPRTLYLAKIAANAQCRSLSSLIEWLLVEGFRNIILGEWTAIEALGDRQEARYPLSLADKVDQLWRPDPADRLVALAGLFPALLDDAELRVWQFVQECDAVWNYKTVLEGTIWRFERTGPDLPTLRRYWDRFEEVAAGKASVATLPRRVWHDGENGKPPTSEIVDPLAKSTADGAGED